MNETPHQDEIDEGRWWRLDFTMALVLLVVISFLMLIFLEFWHLSG